MKSKNMSFLKQRNQCGSQIVKGLRSVLFEQSHLSPYLPIIKEQLTDKIIRIYDDDAYSIRKEIVDNHHHGHRKGKRQKFFSNLLTVSKECYNPIMARFMIWYALVFFCIVSTYFMTGMALFYGQQAWQDLTTNPFTITLNIICIIVFSFDILLQLNAGFLFRGMIIMEKERAMSRYLRSFFVTDVILVAILIITIASSEYYMNIPKMIVILKFMRMFQIDQFYMRKLSTRLNGKAIYVIGKQLITIFVIAHTLGTIYYAIDYALTQNSVCQNDNSLCWLYSATAYSPIMNYGWRVRYFYSLYWGVNTIGTISYGDIAPNNPQEVVFCLACFCFSMITYGYVVNNIIKIILWARNTKDNFRAHLILYTTYMDNLGISKQHQYDFRSYLETQYYQEKDRSFALQEEMKSRLPIDLKQELLKSAYFKIYSGLQFIFFNSPSIVKVLYLLQEKKLTQNELILMQGAPLLQLIYLHKGQVQLSCKYYQRQYTITTINSHDQFVGLYELVLNERAVFTVKTSKNSTVYFLSKQKMQNQLQKYTDLRQNFKLVRDEIKYDNNYKRIFYKCYYCDSNHHWYKCTNVFPNFSNVSLAKHRKKQQNQCRIAYCRFNVWKNRNSLRQLEKISINKEDHILRKLQERVYELRVIKQSRRRDFDIDVHHEWLYYRPINNLSKFKQEWNMRKKRQPQSFFPQLGKLSLKAFSVK